MNRTLSLCLMAITCLTMQAQTKKVYSTIWSFMAPCPKAETTGKKGIETVKWPSTEDRHIKGRDDIWVNDIPVCKDEEIAEHIQKMTSNEPGLVPFTWKLFEEDNMTVLHCYMRMPADAITNFWLTSDEAAIVDRDTGTQYRAIKCVPEDCWKKYFSFKAKKGDMLEFKVFFPLLPETVKRVRIYGVPNWYHRGGNDIDLKMGHKNMLTFDEVPQFHKPTLVRPASDYTKNNSGSWSAYTDAHLIKPRPEGTMALWITPEATYLAIAHEQNWMREYYGYEPGGMLLDDDGHQYKLKELQDYPLGQIFWIEGYSGDCVATVLVYEPLPTYVETITYIDPDGEPFKAWGANWKGTVKHNLSVETLRSNQKYFDYHPRHIVTQ